MIPTKKFSEKSSFTIEKSMSSSDKIKQVIEKEARLMKERVKAKLNISDEEYLKYIKLINSKQNDESPKSSNEFSNLMNEIELVQILPSKKDEKEINNLAITNYFYKIDKSDDLYEEEKLCKKRNVQTQTENITNLKTDIIKMEQSNNNVDQSKKKREVKEEYKIEDDIIDLLSNESNSSSYLETIVKEEPKWKKVKKVRFDFVEYRGKLPSIQSEGSILKNKLIKRTNK